jgi:hypothetical protein
LTSTFTILCTNADVGIVHPAALLAGGRLDFARSIPETECAISNRQFRPHINPASSRIAQQFANPVRFREAT